MNRYIKKFSPIIILSGSIIAFILMIKLKPEAKFQKPKIIPQLVETMNAFPAEVSAKISSQGTIRPEHEIYVTSELSDICDCMLSHMLDPLPFFKAAMGDKSLDTTTFVSTNL